MGLFTPTAGDKSHARNREFKGGIDPLPKSTSNSILIAESTQNGGFRCFFACKW